jgi:hypothetical protein
MNSYHVKSLSKSYSGSFELYKQLKGFSDYVLVILASKIQTIVKINLRMYFHTIRYIFQDEKIYRTLRCSCCNRLDPISSSTFNFTFRSCPRVRYTLISHIDLCKSQFSSNFRGWPIEQLLTNFCRWWQLPNARKFYYPCRFQDSSYAILMRFLLMRFNHVWSQQNDSEK